MDPREPKAMIGLVDCASYIPENRDDNLIKFPHINEDYLEAVAGVRRISKISAEQTPASICINALHNLQKKQSFSLAEIELLVVVTQHTRPSIPPISTEIHGLGGFPENTICLDLSLGCTGYVQALSVTLAYAQQLALKKALLFTVETLSDLPANEELDLLMGDAATVSLISDNPKYIAKDFSFGTKGQLGHHLKYNGKEVFMNGLGVYEFVIRSAPKAIRNLLAKNNLKIEDIQFFAFHQASKRTIDSVGRALGLHPKLAPFISKDFGNTGSCSIPVLLENQLDKNHKKILIAGFGAGMAWAVGILERVEAV